MEIDYICTNIKSNILYPERIVFTKLQREIAAAA